MNEPPIAVMGCAGWCEEETSLLKGKGCLRSASKILTTHMADRQIALEGSNMMSNG